MSRNVSLLNSVFASDAETVVPISPAVGIPYRNPNLTSDKAGQGWPFSTVVDSADFNELMFRVTGLIDFVEKTGGIIWSPLTDYPVGAFVRDEQLIFWEATQASGPNNGGSQNPYAGSQYWKVAEICRVQDTNSIDLSFVNQVLTAALRLAPASGLNAGVDGVRVELNPSVTNAIKIVNGGLLVEDAGGGKALGEIFAYPSAVPPEGAYLLNGQTIANCQGLYPKFWEWLTDNAGDMIATPVYKAWTMPALTADGTLGGSEYAAEASGAVASGYNAYKSFDGTHGGSSTYCSIVGVTSASLIWYSPVKLKFTSLLFQNPTTGTANTRMSTFEIFGSNDGATWDSLTSGTYASTENSATQIVDIPANKFNGDNPGYHYLKIEAVNGGGADTNFPEITIYGQEYLYISYAPNGNIFVLSNEGYEYELARTGVCGGFVINSAAGSVRLPDLRNGTLWGADSTTIGQSLSAGLPNIEGVISSNSSSTTNQTAYEGGFTAQGAFSNSTTVRKTWAPEGTGGANFLGDLVFDASLSSSIYGNSDTVQPPAIRVSWCIQVFNVATQLSEQESAQLASEMQMKAQINLANVNSNIDFVVENWTDGQGNGYSLYRSGKLEQWGIYKPTAANKTRVITLWKEFDSSNYVVFPVKQQSVSTSWNPSTGLGIFNLTPTGFSMGSSGDGEVGVYTQWFAIGKAATE